MAAAPGWLLGLLAPSLPAPVGVRRELPRGTAFTPYGESALAGLVVEVARAPEGRRNETLVRCAYRAGRLALAGELDQATAAAVLCEAATLAGLAPVESQRTIANGLAGAEQAGPARRRPLAGVR